MMLSRWPIIAVWVTAIAASVQSALVPAQDIVVEGPNNAVPSQVSAQRPYDPIKLTEMCVRSDIEMRYARTLMVSQFVNPDWRAQQATFHVVLPETAFISSFQMILDGKAYKAYVKEKEEAKKIYNEAVSQGIAAGHIATQTRDSNQFTVSVNVEGNTTAIFKITYEELLLLNPDRIYNHEINLQPGTLVPKLKVVVHIKEPQKISKLRVPELRTGNEVDATEKDPQNSKAVIVKSADEREVTITFTPDLEEQKRLAKVYLEKTKDKSSSNINYIGNARDVKENKEVSTALGQFVVQYGVEQSNNGEIFVNDGYFVHFFAPTSLTPLCKYIVFVLDTSGSMMGRKIEQLHRAMEAILTDLNPCDFFSIVEFNYGVTVHNITKEAAQEPPPKTTNFYQNRNPGNTTLVPPTLASAENIANAKIIVSRLKANGGTNIYDALNVALDLHEKGVDQEIIKGLKSQNDDSDCDYEYFYDEPEEDNYDLEPVIIFLTDGEATVGVTNTTKIVFDITKRNSGFNHVPLYSLAFGKDADSNFLRRLSHNNDGFSRRIYDAKDAAMQLQDFYKLVSFPLLSHVKFVYSSDQIKENTLSNYIFRIINAGSEIVVVGQLEEDAIEITSEVIGFCGSENGLGRVPFEVFPRVTVIDREDEYLPLERLWAYLTIKQLLDKRESTNDKDTDGNSYEKKALALALKYEFVTPLTSLVVVKPNATNSVDVEAADKIPTQGNSAFRGSTANFAATSKIAAVYKGVPSKPIAPAVLSRPTGASTAQLAPAADSATASKAQPVVQALPDNVSLAPSTPASPYHLDKFPWTSSILNTKDNALVFINNNGIVVILPLTKDVKEPREVGGDVACSGNATVGKVCVYLTRCHAARNITVADYLNSYCSVGDSQGNSFAGFCCPSNEVDINP